MSASNSAYPNEDPLDALRRVVNNTEPKMYTPMLDGVRDVEVVGLFDGERNDVTNLGGPLIGGASIRRPSPRYHPVPTTPGKNLPVPFKAPHTPMGQRPTPSTPSAPEMQKIRSDFLEVGPFQKSSILKRKADDEPENGLETKQLITDMISHLQAVDMISHLRTIEQRLESEMKYKRDYDELFVVYSSIVDNHRNIKAQMEDQVREIGIENARLERKCASYKSLAEAKEMELLDYKTRLLKAEDELSQLRGNGPINEDPQTEPDEPLSDAENKPVQHLRNLFKQNRFIETPVHQIDYPDFKA